MLSGSLDKRRRDEFIHGKTTEITSRWWGLVLVEVGAGGGWCWRRRGRLPVLLHASPLTTLDLRAPLVRLTAGLQGGYNVY